MRTCTRRELESLIGTACKVITPGRSFLRRAISLLSVAKCQELLGLQGYRISLPVYSEYVGIPLNLAIQLPQSRPGSGRCAAPSLGIQSTRQSVENFFGQILSRMAACHLQTFDLSTACPAIADRIHIWAPGGKLNLSDQCS